MISLGVLCVSSSLCADEIHFSSQSLLFAPFHAMLLLRGINYAKTYF